MRMLLLILLLLLFIAGGIYGIFSTPFLQTHTPLYNWILLLAFPVGIFYTFALTPKYSKNQGGKIALGRIAITILVSMLIFRSGQGYLVLYNCNIGKQTTVLISGKIIETDFPKPRQLFDKNSIRISLVPGLEEIELDVPGTQYEQGQLFEKIMIRGSLNILYASK